MKYTELESPEAAATFFMELMISEKADPAEIVTYIDKIMERNKK